MYVSIIISYRPEVKDVYCHSISCSHVFMWCDISIWRIQRIRTRWSCRNRSTVKLLSAIVSCNLTFNVHKHEHGNFLPLYNMCSFQLLYMYAYLALSMLWPTTKQLKHRALVLYMSRVGPMPWVVGARLGHRGQRRLRLRFQSEEMGESGPPPDGLPMVHVMSR